jgi:hypothetical protein
MGMNPTGKDFHVFSLEHNPVFIGDKRVLRFSVVWDTKFNTLYYVLNGVTIGSSKEKHLCTTPVSDIPASIVGQDNVFDTFLNENVASLRLFFIRLDELTWSVRA